MTLYLIICTASFLISVLTLFSGFGLGTLLLPLFAIFFPIEIAVAATALVHLVNNIFKFFLVGRFANFKITALFSVPAILSAAFGAWLLTQIGTLPVLASYALSNHVFQVEPIKLVIGVLIFVFALFELIPALGRISVAPKYIPLGGLLSGFFGGLSGMQGALRSLFLIRAGLSKEQYIGTCVASAILVDCSRILVYGYVIWGQHLAILSTSNLEYLILAAILAAITGSLLSSRLLEKTTLSTVQKIVGGLLILISIGLMGGLF